jgi:glycosyltransferase involved in cell wall biosynthesis
MFPLPYELQPFSHSYDTDLVYIGNNYNRYEQAVMFLEGFAKASPRVHVYGNWLEPNPERESPEKVKQDFPHVKFLGRLPQNQIIDVLSKARTTIHLFKPEYGAHGFIAPRWAEAAAAGVPAFVPSTFRVAPEDTKGWEKFIVDRGSSITSAFGAMYDSTHDEVAEAQRAFAKKYMRAEAWVEMIEAVIYGDCYCGR